MRRAAMFCLILAVLIGSAYGQATVTEEVTVFGSYGLADVSQAIDTGDAGAYTTLKNGYSVNSNLGFNLSVPLLYSIQAKLNTKSRVGSGYVPLQLVGASSQAWALTVDQVSGKVNLSDILQFSEILQVTVQAGKYQVTASNPQKISGYGVESALAMVKTSNALNVGAEATYRFETDDPSLPTPTLSLQVTSSALVDEAVVRLYDNDGSQSNHGKAVIGQYAPQALGIVKLSALPLGPFSLSAEAAYGLNLAGIYSGNTYGAGALLTTTLVPEVLSIPVGAGVAYHEKNIDVLAGSVGTDISDKTVDFRSAIRAGVAAGLRFQIPLELAVETNISGSYTSISHIYREPVTFLGAAVDGRVTLTNLVFVGGGVVLPTLSSVVWQTKSTVATIYDDYKKTFDPAKNLGYEIFTGINLGSKASMVLGFNTNKGMAMNYGIESVKDGEYKFRQKGSDAADRLYETSALFLKFNLKV